MAAAILPFEREGFAETAGSWPVACRDIHLNTSGAEDCWAAVKSLGADGAEVSVTPEMVCPNLFHPTRKYSLASHESIQDLKADLQRAGVQITAFMMANRLEERLEEEVKWTGALANAAEKLGVKAIRIDVWPVKLSKEDFLPFAIKACRRLCEAAADTQVRFGIENHGRVTNDPEFLDKLFAGVGSAKLGLTLDCANFYWFGHPLSDLYALYEKYAARVVHTHCKSIAYPEDRKNSRRPIGWEYEKYACPIDQGDIDFARLAEILRKGNYRGDLCLEDESLGKFPAAERAAIVRREIALLKRVSRKT